MLQAPCGFSGGTLRLFQTQEGDQPQADPDQFHDITPAYDMIVFFDILLLREVQLHGPVRGVRGRALHA